jgi:adenosylcobinamide-GDP ribazoletransferase
MSFFPNLAAYSARIRTRLTTLSFHFFLALGFLTRLGPALRAEATDISKSVLYYPVVGAVLGAVLTLPPAFGLFSGRPLVQAWCYAVLSLWLTRVLHFDGLADVLDALGSGKRECGFQSVLKDSRIGAFGSTGIASALAGQIVVAAALLESGQLAPLFFAPVYGRCLPILLASLATVHPKAGLGSILAAAPRKAAPAFAAFCALCGGIFCLSPPGLVLCLLLTLPCMIILVRLARREGGYNGDFLGAAIVAGEICALLATVLASA